MAAAIAAAPAGAATVSASEGTLRFVGGTEQNDLRVKSEQLTPGSLLCNPYAWDVCVQVPTDGKSVATVTDTAGGLLAGDNCWARGSEATCVISGGNGIAPHWNGLTMRWKPNIEANLGAGDDAATLDYGGVGGGSVDGGAGSDTLSGVVEFAGGSGDDRLTYNGSPACTWQDGGEGADVLVGGGYCTRQDGGPGPDVFRAGTVTYEKRSTPVTVTQDGIANDGAPGEGDQTAEALGVVGSAAADTMTGGGERDRLLGGPGADRLLGGVGDDSLAGEDGGDWIDGQDGNDSVAGDAWDAALPGDDVLIGGAGIDNVSGEEGNDDLRVRDGERDTVYCDGGIDTLTADVIDDAPYNDFYTPGYHPCEKRING